MKKKLISLLILFTSLSGYAGIHPITGEYEFECSEKKFEEVAEKKAIKKIIEDAEKDTVKYMGEAVEAYNNAINSEDGEVIESAIQKVLKQSRIYTIAIDEHMRNLRSVRYKASEKICKSDIEYMFEQDFIVAEDELVKSMHTQLLEASLGLNGYSSKKSSALNDAKRDIKPTFDLEVIPAVLYGDKPVVLQTL